MTDAEPLPPGSIIGILGGGQLGRMLTLAAARLGMKTHIYCPDADSPAFDVTPRKTVAAYDDAEALAGFAAAVDVVTYEFENVPLATAHRLAGVKPLYPSPFALAVAQDRLAEKTFIRAEGVPVAPYRAVETLADLEAALLALGTPAVLKTTRLGYDGKGQRVIRTPDQAAAAFAELAPKPLVLEAFVPFDKEISVVLARGADGDIRAFEPSLNVHRNHILHTSTVPAGVSSALAAEATAAATKIAAALDYVGVLGVEFFVTGETLLVNEIAPRVHNSGHWTEGGLRHRPVRAAHPGYLSLAARRPCSTRARGDGKSHRRRGGRRPGTARPRYAAAALWQGRNAAGPQNGPSQPHRPRELT